MLERPLSPWRGPEGPLTRLRASRDGLAILAIITILLLGIVGISLSVADRDAPPPSPPDVPTGQVSPSEDAP